LLLPYFSYISSPSSAAPQAFNRILQLSSDLAGKKRCCGSDLCVYLAPKGSSHVKGASFQAKNDPS
jgi:hypothetical protein